MEKDKNTIVTKSKEKCRNNPLNNKWDECLDDYDNYLKEYIKQYKKSLKGNLVSLSKYPYMKVKSEALCERLNDAHNKNHLTEKQLKRLSKIKMKIIYACSA